MNLLFRLSQTSEGFLNINEAKEYLAQDVPTHENSYFYVSKIYHELKNGDSIYFSYDNKLIAFALVVNRNVNIERNQKFKYGIQLKDIEIFEQPIPINNKIFSYRTSYVRTKEQQLYLKKVIEKQVFLFNDETTYIEGKSIKVNANRYERDINARRKCLEIYGYDCVGCGINFEKKYGHEFKGLIHVHHLIPLKDIRKEYSVDPKKDLIPLCPNCHMLIHAGNGLSLDELKSLCSRSDS